MRSRSRVDPGQTPLWEESTDESARRPRARSGTGPQWQCHEVTGDEFMSRGWAAGTVLHYEPVRRVDRGALAVVRAGERTLVGEFGLERGRPVLRSDHGAVWLGPHTQVIGVVRMVEPPLLLGGELDG